MAAHSSILAWKIPWAEETSGLQSMGLQRVAERREGLRVDLIDRVPDELWMEVHDIEQETGIKTIPMEKSGRGRGWEDLGEWH